MSSPTSSGGPSTNPFLSSPTAAATAGNTTQPIVDLFGSLPATAETSQVIIQNYRPDFNITLIGDGHLFHLRIFGGQVQQTGQPHKKLSILKRLLHTNSYHWFTQTLLDLPGFRQEFLSKTSEKWEGTL